MNAALSLADELSQLLQNPRDPSVLTQALAVVGALLAAWLLARGLQRWLSALAPAAEARLGAGEQPRGGWTGVMLPLAAFVLLALARSIFNARALPTPLIDLASTLTLTYGLVRLLAYALRRAFAPNALLRASERLIATIVWLGVVLHLFGLLPRLRQQLDTMSFHIGAQEISLLLILQLIAAVALTIVVALWLSRFFEARIMAQSAVDLSLRAALAKILRTVLLFLAVLIALPMVGIDITALSVFGGALGVGVGFGLQKIASNYVSGFIILLERSIRLGDLVTVDERQGVVARINARYTVVRGLDGTEAIIPNETFITHTVINQSATDRRLMVRVPLQISYESDIEAALRVMETAGRAQPRVLTEPTPLAVVKGFADSGIDLELLVWVGDPEQGVAPLRSDIFRTVWREFKAEGITIPYPQREIRILNDAATSTRFTS
jgi:small-conductance mechanosensitive channel